MTKLRALAVLAVIAACADKREEPFDAVPDALVVCNPVAQTGCAAGEKCTWIVDLDSTPTMVSAGHIGCAAAGSTADGASCDDAAAVSGGVDSCAAGALCVASSCKPICDPQLVGGVDRGACPTDSACSTYGDLFSSSGTAVAGVCEPTCDPLTQQLDVGTLAVAACGSRDPAQPAATCVASAGFRSFHCAPTEAMFYGKRDRDPPLTDSAGKAYDNGCAPGFIPFYFEDSSGAMKTLCSGLCAPLKVDATIAAQAGHRDDNRGDKAASGKLPEDAAPAPGRATCDAGVKGSAVSSPRGEDCRFLWFPLAKGDPTKPLSSPFNDSLGVCFAYEKFLSVTVPGVTPKQAEKSCADLPAAPTDDPFGSAKDNGCYPLAESIGLRARRPPSFRLSYGDGVAVRHVFE